MDSFKICCQFCTKYHVSLSEILKGKICLRCIIKIPREDYFQWRLMDYPNITTTNYKMDYLLLII